MPTYNVRYNAAAAIARIHERAIKAVEQTGHQLAIESVDWLDLMNHIASGRMAESLKSAPVVADGGKISGGLISGVDYTQNFIDGVLPGTIVPLEALIDWVNAKVGAGRMTLPQGFDPEGFAQRVQLRIQRRGVPPHNFPKVVAPKVIDDFRSRSRKAITS